MKFAVTMFAALAISGGVSYTAWHLYDEARFERGRQQFLADTADLAPTAQQSEDQREPERYLFIDNALAKTARR